MKSFSRVNCFFEQSGTFRDVFRKLGYEAYDYDISNDYGKTDFQTDIFRRLMSWDMGGKKPFEISSDELIIAFFPCIYFCQFSKTCFSFGYAKNLNWDLKNNEFWENVMYRNRQRANFFEYLTLLVKFCVQYEIPLIIENPYNNGQNYLLSTFFKSPDFIDLDRSLHGDRMKKGTMYYFIGISPNEWQGVYPYSGKLQRVEDLPKGKKSGVCSKERSEISSVYAEYFIRDIILNEKKIEQCSLF